MTIEQQWLQTCESFAQATPREWSANDERLYRSGLALIAAVRAEERQRHLTSSAIEHARELINPKEEL